MITAMAIDNPAGVPRSAPKLSPTDYTYAAAVISLDEIISRAGRNAHASLTIPIKRVNITFIIQPYLDQHTEPRLWLEAYTSDPDLDPAAELIGMARIYYSPDDAELKEKAQAIRTYLRSLAMLHEE